MKLNWGQGIFIFYCIFLLTIVWRIVASLGVDTSLVIDEYYTEDINFQRRLDKVYNANKDKILNHKHDKVNNTITLDFDTTAEVKGNIHFYRASDEAQDFTKEINQNTHTFSLNGILAGRWILKVDWTINKTEYYKEIKISI